MLLLNRYYYSFALFTKGLDPSHVYNTQMGKNIRWLFKEEELECKQVNGEITKETVTFCAYDPFIEKVEVSAELRKAVTRNIPSNCDDETKAIYIYVNLCNILSYNKDYYINRYGVNDLNSDESKKMFQILEK